MELQKQIDKLIEVCLYWSNKESKTEFEMGYVRGLEYAIDFLEGQLEKVNHGDTIQLDNAR